MLGDGVTERINFLSSTIYLAATNLMRMARREIVDEAGNRGG
jgi:hypothetical protein